jgi:hypothetical protein
MVIDLGSLWRATTRGLLLLRVGETLFLSHTGVLDLRRDAERILRD